jgi:hypothetical protein
MAFNIADFRASINSRGIARPSKFLVRIFAAPGMVGDFDAVVRDMEMWAEATELPVFGLHTGDHPRYGYGPDEKRVVRPIYQDVKLRIISDEHMANWRFFKTWLNLIVESDMSGGIAGGGGAAMPYEINYKDQYLTGVNIQTFDEFGNLRASVVLRDAFPVALEAIELAWANGEEYMRVPVTIAFTDWYEEPTEEAAEGGEAE